MTRQSEEMDSPSKHIFDHILFSAELGSNSCAAFDAEIATPCGHSFCGFCVDHFRANRKANCQMCQQPVVSYSKNRLANDMLATINGECTWCQQELPLDTTKQHVQRCDQIQVSWDLCKQPFKRKDLQNHLQECIFRDVICLCGMRQKKKHEEEHVRTTCTFREEPCPLNCGASVKRYLEGNCPEKLVSLDGLELDKDLPNYKEILQTNRRRLLSEHFIDGKKRTEVEVQKLYVTVQERAVAEDIKNATKDKTLKRTGDKLQQVFDDEERGPLSSKLEYFKSHPSKAKKEALLMLYNDVIEDFQHLEAVDEHCIVVYNEDGEVD